MMTTHQTLKKTCNVTMILILITTMMVSSTHSGVLENCVKHCVPNQCMKIAKKGTIPLCEEACKKLCKEKQTPRVQYTVTPDPDSYCDRYFGILC
ncbi:unnamed protein product [Cochlearia groenlandica]